MTQLDLGSIVYWIGLFGIAVFAVSGALDAARKEMDILGFLLIGTVTGLGGGTLRDVLLGVAPVYWVIEPHYVLTCLIASAATYFTAPYLASRYRALIWMDAIGLATFSVTGAEIALVHGASALIAVCMGVMTASFGGIIRDVLCGESLVLGQRELYVTAALAGASSYLLLKSFEAVPLWSTLGAFSIAFGLRAAAILFDLQLPTYGNSRMKEE